MGKTTKSRHAAADGGTLTPKQQAFLSLYGSGKFATATAAAIAAGYSPTSARGTVYDLLRHPQIRTGLDKIADQMRERTAYDALACFKEAGEAMAFARETKNANAFTRAVELRGRLYALLVDKQELTLAPAPSVANALAEARARVGWVDNQPTAAALLPMRCQDDTQDAEYRVLPSDQDHGPRDI